MGYGKVLCVESIVAAVILSADEIGESKAGGECNRGGAGNSGGIIACHGLLGGISVCLLERYIR